MPNPTLDVLRLRNRALDATNVSVAIADAQTPDRPLINVNPAFVDMTGYAAADVLGKNCRFLQGPRTDPVEKDARGAAIRAGMDSQVVLVNYRKTGEPFWNEVNISPVHDADGVLTHFVATQRNITDQVRADRSRQLLNDIESALADPLDKERVLQPVAEHIVARLADKCVVYLATEEDEPRLAASATSVDEQLRPDLAGALRDILTAHNVPAIVHHCLAQRTRASVNLAPAETNLPLCLVVAPIIGPTRLFGALCFVMDHRLPVTIKEEELLAAEIGHRIGSLLDHGQLYEDLQKAIAVRDEFLSIAAHELRTPISSIKGYSQLLMRGLERGTLLPERLRLGIRTIESSASRLTTLTNDLLEVSRVGMDSVPLHPEPIAVHGYLRAFLRDRRTLDHDGHEFRLLSNDPGVWVNADLGRLDQVMSNLASNAEKYAPDRPIIELETFADRDGVVILIRDYGLGMDPDDLDRVFQPFQRSAIATASNIPGMGLGLFISRNIIERHGGSLTAHSDGLGHGTTFRIWLPKSAPPDPDSDA